MYVVCSRRERLGPSHPEPREREPDSRRQERKGRRKKHMGTEGGAG